MPAPIEDFLPGNGERLPLSDYLRAGQTSRQLLAAAKRQGAGGGRVPLFDWTRQPAGGGLGDALSRYGVVSFADPVVRDLADLGRLNPPSRPAAVVLHEAAHTWQRPSLFSRRPVVEGGAQAFAQTMVPRVLRDLGYSQKNAVIPTYSEWTNNALRRSLDWILRQQFSR